MFALFFHLRSGDYQSLTLTGPDSQIILIVS